MKKITAKLLTLILALIMSFTLVACDDDKNDNNGDGEGQTQTTGFYNKNEKEDVSLTDKVFIANGTSDYKIVIPSSATDSTRDEPLFAANEIVYFVSDATGVNLPIIYDTDIEYNENNKYISIGDTSIYNGSAMKDTLSVSVLGNDGFKIETYGNLVVMNAYGDNGILYTAYGFLERIMDWNYYAEDCWTMTDDDIIYMKDMSVVDIPTFNQRQINTGASDDAVYCIRMRQHGQQGQDLVLGEAGGWCLGDMSIAQQILQAKVYQTTYPSWYWGDGMPYTGQPCLEALLRNYSGDESQNTVCEEDTVNEYDLENGTGAFDVFMRNLIFNYTQSIVNTPEARVYMLGANDNTTPCQCATCKARYEEVKASGQYCMFANKVSDAFAEWQNSLQPGDEYYEHKFREVKFAFFAYLFAEESPTVYDEATNTYTPINEDVILNDNVIARIAPIRSVNMHLHTEKLYNPGSAAAFASWSTVSQVIAIWDYGCSFLDAVVPYGDWGTLKENFLIYRDINVQEVFTQLQSRTSGYGLRALKIYQRAQLMWDLDQDIYELTDKFFENYYGKDAGVYIKNYYEYLQSVYQTFDVDGIDHGYIYSISLSTTQCWTYNMANKIGSFFDDAIDSIEYLKTEDKALYEKYYEHINCEMLFYDYVMIKNYNTYFTDNEINALIDHFEQWRKVAGLKLMKIQTKDTSYDGWADNYRR